MCELGNHRISIFDPSGQFLRDFGTQGSKVGQFSFPCGIAVDNEGSIVVADQRNHRIQIFSKEGKFQSTFGGPGSEDGLLNNPYSPVIDREGNLLITDSTNHRIQVFSPNRTKKKKKQSQLS